MNDQEIIEMARQAGGYSPEKYPEEWRLDVDDLSRFAKLVAEKERLACIALHNHEDVLAPIGHSAWGEAYQDGWCKGTAIYRKAIEARGQE